MPTAVKRGKAPELTLKFPSKAADYCTISAFMTRLRTVLAFVILGLPCAGAWTSDQKGWALGTGGILTQMGYERHDVLYDNAPSPAAEREGRSQLAAWRDVHTKAELLSTIHSLLSEQGDRVLIV